MEFYYNLLAKIHLYFDLYKFYILFCAYTFFFVPLQQIFKTCTSTN